MGGKGLSAQNVLEIYPQLFKKPKIKAFKIYILGSKRRIDTES